MKTDIRTLGERLTWLYHICRGIGLGSWKTDPTENKSRVLVSLDFEVADFLAILETADIPHYVSPLDPDLIIKFDTPFKAFKGKIHHELTEVSRAIKTVIKAVDEASEGDIFIDHLVENLVVKVSHIANSLRTDFDKLLATVERMIASEVHDEIREFKVAGQKRVWNLDKALVDGSVKNLNDLNSFLLEGVKTGSIKEEDLADFGRSRTFVEGFYELCGKARSFFGSMFGSKGEINLDSRRVADCPKKQEQVQSLLDKLNMKDYYLYDKPVGSWDSYDRLNWRQVCMKDGKVSKTAAKKKMSDLAEIREEDAMDIFDVRLGDIVRRIETGISVSSCVGKVVDIIPNMDVVEVLWPTGSTQEDPRNLINESKVTRSVFDFGSME